MPSTLLERPIQRFDRVPEGMFQSPYTVSHAKAGDLGAFRNLLVNTIGALNLDDKDRLEKQREKRTAEFYEAALHNPLTAGGEWTLLMSKANGAIAGVLEGKLTADRMAGVINWVCVDSEHQGQGVATHLYRAYEYELKKHNIPYMLAYVDNDNASSLRLHEKCGFDMKNLYAQDERGKWYFKSIA